MRTANPALKENTFRNLARTSDAVMTLPGTVHKSFMLIALTIGSALFSWNMSYSSSWSPEAIPAIPTWYFPIMILSLVVAFIIIFKKTTAPYLAPVYAIGEGFLLGAISALFDYRYPGIAIQATLCTAGTFLGLLLAYQSKLIRATENFKLGVVSATLGIGIVYLIDMGMRFFGMNVPYLHENGTVGILISLVIVVVAALNLVLDFDFIENGVAQRAPKYMEWYAAFGLLVTLVWLYLEILRLLGKTKK